MAYELTEEQIMIRDTVRKLSQEKIAPRAAEIDETAEYPWDVFEALKENGLLSVNFPKKYGGMAAGSLTLAIIVEEVAKADGGCAIIPCNSELSFQPLILAGSDELNQRYLPGVVKGDIIGGYCLTEPDAGSDVSSMKTTATKQGDHYIINGQKSFTTNGGIAHTFVVFARDPQSKGARGISVFVVDRNTPGVVVGEHERKMGIRGNPTTQEFFDNVRVPARNLVGEEGAGFGICMMTLDRTRPVVGAQAIGIAQGAFDYSLDYAKNRKQFNQPVARFQGMQFKFADMIMAIESARQLLYYACSEIDRLPEDQKRFPPRLSMLSSMAKTVASDMAQKITSEAVSVLGGYGYIKEYPVERMMRDAKITQIYEGTNEVERWVIGRILTE